MGQFADQQEATKGIFFLADVNPQSLDLGDKTAHSAFGDVETKNLGPIAQAMVS